MNRKDIALHPPEPIVCAVIPLQYLSIFIRIYFLFNINILYIIQRQVGKKNNR